MVLDEPRFRQHLFFLNISCSHTSITYLFLMKCPDGSVPRCWCRIFTKQSTNKQTITQVLLAKHKADNKFYAIKVLQKKIILKKKEVLSLPLPF